MSLSVIEKSLRCTVVSNRGVARVRTWQPYVVRESIPVFAGDWKFPAQVGSTTLGSTTPGSARVLCLGPGDWLWVGPLSELTALREQLESERPVREVAFVNLSAGLMIFELRGSETRAVLAKKLRTRHASGPVSSRPVRAYAARPNSRCPGVRGGRPFRAICQP